MFSSFTLIYLLFVFKRIVEISLLSFIHLPFRIFRCLTSLYFTSSLVVQFSRTNLFFAVCLFSGDFDIISYLFPFVKTFFKSFLFSFLFTRFPAWTAFIFYHISSLLSTPFLPFFIGLYKLPIENDSK